MKHDDITDQLDAAADDDSLPITIQRLLSNAADEIRGLRQELKNADRTHCP